jgi:hypothetical protein
MCKSLVSRIIERYAASHAVRSASLIRIVANIGPDFHLAPGLFLPIICHIGLLVPLMSRRAVHTSADAPHAVHGVLLRGPRGGAATACGLLADTASVLCPPFFTLYGTHGTSNAAHSTNPE